MSKQPFTIVHNLDGLDKNAVKKYLDEMSAYIGLDPTLNGLDTIYMNDPQGGRALVPYARRGTCEILRNLYEVEVQSLIYATVSGSIVFTATGRSQKRGNRQEIAVGSKYVEGLKEKTLDNAIMTASTRALQRLTMQFTELGILAESEVVDLVGQTPNLAGSAQLASNPLPPTFLPPPSVPANNAPGKPVESTSEPKAAPASAVDLGQPFVGQKEQIAAAHQQLAAKEAAQKVSQSDIKAGPTSSENPVTAAESTTSSDLEADKKAVKKTRKKVNTVVLDVEPEIVQKAPPPHAIASAQANPVAPAQAHSVTQNLPIQGVSLQTSASIPPATSLPNVSTAAAAPAVEGMPSKEQMDEYRKKISVYTVQLPPSQDLGPTQKMRAFITKVSGTAPGSMTVDQWDELISFIDGFMERNQGNVKNLVKYINDLLGVK